MDSIVVERLAWLLSAVLVIATLPGTIELALLFWSAALASPRAGLTRTPDATRASPLLFRSTTRKSDCLQPCAVLMSCDDLLPASDLIVMACNCTDRTVELARAAGCTVLERIDPTRRGKGYGLNFAFRHLARENYDA